MPTDKPTVLRTVIDPFAFVVAKPFKATGIAKPRPVPAEPRAVAAELMTKVVPFVTETTVEPAGIFGPETTMPGKSPEVLVTVTVLPPKVVAIAVSET